MELQRERVAARTDLVGLVGPSITLHDPCLELRERIERDVVHVFLERRRHLDSDALADEQRASRQNLPEAQRVESAARDADAPPARVDLIVVPPVVAQFHLAAGSVVDRSDGNQLFGVVRLAWDFSDEGVRQAEFAEPVDERPAFRDVGGEHARELPRRPRVDAAAKTILDAVRKRHELVLQRQSREIAQDVPPEGPVLETDEGRKRHERMSANLLPKARRDS